MEGAITFSGSVTRIETTHGLAWGRFTLEREMPSGAIRTLDVLAPAALLDLALGTYVEVCALMQITTADYSAGQVSLDPQFFARTIQPI